MNDDELRAFLESATVGDGAPTPPGAPQSNPTAAGAAEGVTARSERDDSAPKAPLSFEELIGTKREARPQADAPVAGDDRSAAGRAPEFTSASHHEAVEPLVLPDPHRTPQADPALTPLFLPEPKNLYQSAPPQSEAPAPSPDAAAPVTASLAAAAGGAAAQPATEPLDALFLPTQQMDRADLPDAPESHTAPATSAAPAAKAAATAALAAAATAATGVGAGFTATPRATDPFASLTGGEPHEVVEVTGRPAARGWLPWAIVGGGAAIALVASFFIVNAVQGTGDPAPTAAPPATTQPETPSTPSTPGTPGTDANDEDDADDEETDENQPPTVEVGPTMTLPVTQWGITADLSARFGQTYYNINTPDQLVLNSALIDTLPESCAPMRQEWGITRVDATTFEVKKPATKCTEAPELYDELWGLTAAMVKSITPQ